MTEEEAEALFVEINTILRKQGLAWLANEIAGEASEGRASPKMLSVHEHTDVSFLEDTVSRPTRRKTEFTHVRPLTSKEKIGVSIKALRAILVSSGKILPEIIHTINATDDATISFVAETDSSSTISSETEAARFSLAATVLDHQLRNLEQEVGHGS